MILTMFPMNAFATGPIVTDPSTRDIFINIDSDAGYNASDLADAVSTEITSIGGTSTPVFRIKTNSTEINTTDLSGWYVYDHYDTAYWAARATTLFNSSQIASNDSSLAWKKDLNMSSLTDYRRPYTGQSCSDSYGATYKIADYISVLNSGSGSVQKFDQHIYAGTEANGAFMTFLGYGSPAYMDYLFYPDTLSGTKTVTYNIDSAKIDTHTLNSAGFLINTGVDSSGYIKGYIIVYAYSDSTHYTLNLYKINDSVTAQQLSGQNTLTTYCGSAVTASTSGALAVLSSTDVTLTITADSVKVEQKAPADATYTTVRAWTGLSSTGYNGFGPYIKYSSHGCPSLTSYKFSKLTMSSSTNATTSVSALASLQNADYLDANDTKRYLVNILGNNSSYDLSKDQNYLSTVQSQSIRLFTNKDVSAISNYLPGYYVDTTSASIATLATSIANYVLETTGTVTPTPTPAITTSTVAIFTLTSGAVQVSQIRRELIPDGGVNLGVNNKSIPSSGAALGTPVFTLVNPSGSEITNYIVPFTVTNSAISWPTGEYKLTLDYGTGTIPSTVKFRIVEDVVAPTVVATSSSGIMNFTITNVTSSGVNAYTTDLDSYVIKNTTSAAATTSDWTNEVHIINNATSGTADITQSGYMHVLVKDIAGNIGQAYIYAALLYPTITAPVASNINVGQQLSDSTLSGGSAVYGSTTVAGVFTWVNPTTVPAIGTTTFSAIFTPTPSGIYGTVTTNVAVTVIQPSQAQKTIKLTEASSDVLENTNLIEVSAIMNLAFANSVEVKITDVQPTDESIFKIVAGDSNIYPFDISVYNTITKKKVQPNAGYKVKITLPLPEKLWSMRDKVKVGYLKEGKLVILASTLVQKQGVWCVVFEADHFSPYAFILNNEQEVLTPGALGTTGFVDVSEKNWFYNAVQYINSRGLMAGITKDTFGPNLKTTRGMIVTILYRMEGEPKATSASSFSDVVSGKYYTDAVAWAAENGVVLGYDAQNYKPNQDISRQQMAAILYRYATYKGYDMNKTVELTAYPDANNISQWARANFIWTVAEELITGTTNNALDPKGYLTRAQAATTLMRFIENIK